MNLLIFLLTFVTMEFMAWFTHKYVMHGFLWYFHKDHHHRDHDHVWERNDFFFLIFAVPSFLCFLFGSMNGFDFRVWIGLGILVYGVAYFFVHDIFIHQRIKLFRNSKHPYLLALRRAHKAHHKHLGKEKGECFGMLCVPFKYFVQARTHLKQSDPSLFNK